MRWQFKHALTNEGWVNDLFVETDASGLIVSLDDTSLAAVDEVIEGFALSGMPNAHSHAFQYVMAGLTECVGQTNDSHDFWSWRRAMYQIALNIKPEATESIAAMLYAEMLRHGITSVAEFHYVQKDQDGHPYSNSAELSERLIAAAAIAGINLCLVPVYYQFSDFGKPALSEQRRFEFAGVDEYFALIEKIYTYRATNPGLVVGTGVHSLRAANAEQVVQIMGAAGDGPIHIHIAEQLKEVEACVQALGSRPVEWLLSNVKLNSRHQLVHATHLNDSEIANLANTDATVVLCPSTEGNLGDGIFPLREFRSLGGRWSIGTDSHISLNIWEDLRWLDYQNRLISKKRNILCDQNRRESGGVAYSEAWSAGQSGVGSGQTSYFEVGQFLNVFIIDPEHPVILAKPIDKILSSMIYAGEANCINQTICRGQTVVKDGIHRDHESIVSEYKKSAKALLA